MNYFPKAVFFLLALVAPVGAHTVLRDTGVNAIVEEMENLDLSVELMAKFHSWAEEHDKSYDSHDEKLRRLKVWVENDGTYCRCQVNIIDVVVIQDERILGRVWLCGHFIHLFPLC